MFTSRPASRALGGERKSVFASANTVVLTATPSPIERMETMSSSGRRESPPGVAQIATKVTEERRVPGVANVVLESRDAAELPERCLPCLLR